MEREAKLQFMVFQKFVSEKSEMNYWFIIHDIKEISEKNTEISAMCDIPKPHQPPHSSYFGILMFTYRKENRSFQMKVCHLLENQ